MRQNNSRWSLLRIRNFKLLHLMIKTAANAGPNQQNGQVAKEIMERRCLDPPSLEIDYSFARRSSRSATVPYFPKQCRVGNVELMPARQMLCLCERGQLRCGVLKTARKQTGPVCAQTAGSVRFPPEACCSHQKVVAVAVAVPGWKLPSDLCRKCLINAAMGTNWRTK